MIHLYWSAALSTHWIAHSEALGWVEFPARIDGWSQRRPYRGDTSRLRKVPARLGFNTGFPHPDATPVLAITNAQVFEEAQARLRRVA